MEPGNALPTMHAAEAPASQIFAEIGVAIQWSPTRQCLSKNAIQVSPIAEAPARQPPSALAESFPYEGTHIVVFLDRVCNVRTKDGQTALDLARKYKHTHLIASLETTGVTAGRYPAQ
jgi:hypothetical protein